MAIIDGIPEPKLGDREKIEQDNNEYNKPLNKPLDETKQELKSIFGDFSKSKENPNLNQEKKLIDPLADLSDEKVEEDLIYPEKMQEDIYKHSQIEEELINKNHNNIPDYSDTGTEEEYQEKLNDEKIKNTPEYPLVKNFLEEKNIPVDNLSLNEEGKIDIFDIDGLSVEDTEMLEGLLVNLEGENRMQNIINLSEYIKDIPEFKDYNIKMGDNGFEDGVLNKIGENYINIPDKNGEIDIRKNTSTAIELAKNQINNEVKNFNRDSQTYKTAISNIDSGNLKKQLEGINSLYYLAYSSEGKLGAKDSLKIHKDKRKKELLNEAKEIDQQLKQQNITEKEKQQIEKRKQEIKQELSEITGIKDGKRVGDIFEAGDLDKVYNKEPKQKEVN